MNPFLNPLPTDLDGGYSSLGARPIKFVKSMEVSCRFKSVDELHKEADVVLLKAMKTEMKRLMLDPS